MAFYQALLVADLREHAPFYVLLLCPVVVCEDPVTYVCVEPSSML
jgi:hypothetical protein